MSKKNKIEENVEIVEKDGETLAASSLHPAARSIPDEKAVSPTKVAMMKAMTAHMSSMGYDDMCKWFDKAIAHIGHEADGVGDNSEKNKSSIAMNPSHASGKSGDVKEPMPKLASITPGQMAKEDVENLFAGEDLSEEFKDKAHALFEAAVATQSMIIREELLEKFEGALNEEVEKIHGELVESLDKYLDYAVENWMEENEVAVESSLRSEITENFIDGLKNLFSDNFIDVPEEKVDVVENLAARVEELERELNEKINENVSLKSELLNTEVDEVVEEVSADMAMTQKEKFAALAEEIDFEGDLDVYKAKLMIVKEKYFSEAKPRASNIEEETFTGDENALTENRSTDPNVNRYVQAIARTIKK